MRNLVESSNQNERLVESSNQNERLNGTIDTVQLIMMAALGVGTVAKPVLPSAPGSVHVDWGQSMLDWGQSMWIGVWTDNPIVYTRARTGTIMVYWCVIFNLACRWLLRILAIFFTLGGHSSSKKQQSAVR